MANLLVVDDNVEATRPLAMLLRLIKHQVDVAASGDEALTCMINKLPDVVILDVMMPGMDGMEVLRRMRADGRMSVVPVIMFSAVSDPEYQHAALRKGADDYVVKGTEFEKLRSRIERLAGMHHIGAAPDVDCGSVTTQSRPAVQ